MVSELYRLCNVFANVSYPCVLQLCGTDDTGRFKGLAKLGNIVADTLLRTQLFPGLIAQETETIETTEYICEAASPATQPCKSCESCKPIKRVTRAAQATTYPVCSSRIHLCYSVSNKKQQITELNSLNTWNQLIPQLLGDKIQ